MRARLAQQIPGHDWRLSEWETIPELQRFVAMVEFCDAIGRASLPGTELYDMRSMRHALHSPL